MYLEKVMRLYVIPYKTEEDDNPASDCTRLIHIETAVLGALPNSPGNILPIPNVLLRHHPNIHADDNSC